MLKAAWRGQYNPLYNFNTARQLHVESSMTGTTSNKWIQLQILAYIHYGSRHSDFGQTPAVRPQENNRTTKQGSHGQISSMHHTAHKKRVSQKTGFWMVLLCDPEVWDSELRRKLVWLVQLVIFGHGSRVWIISLRDVMDHGYLLWIGAYTIWAMAMYIISIHLYNSIHIYRVQKYMHTQALIWRLHDIDTVDGGNPAPVNRWFIPL